MRYPALFLAALAVLAAAATAQNYTGDFILGGSNYFRGNVNDAIFRVDRQNRLTTIVTSIYTPSTTHFVWEVIMAEDNQDFFALSSHYGQPFKVTRVAANGTILSTLYQSSGNAWAVNMHLDQNGKLIIFDCGGSSTGPSTFFELDPASGSLTTTATLPRGDSFYGSACRDIGTGDDLAFVRDMLFRVDKAGGAVTTLVNTGVRMARMGLAQDTLTGKAYAGTCCTQTIYELDLVNNAWSTLVGPMSFHGNYGLKFDRRVNATTNFFYDAHGAFDFANRFSGISKIDTAGVVTSLIRWPSATGAPMPYSLEIEGSREVQPQLVTPPNGRRIRLSFPGHGGKNYVSAIGVSGILPAIPLGDGRVIHLVVDSIVLASVQGFLDAFIPNRVGQLDAFGRAVMGLDVNALGAAVRGLPVVVQVLVLDAAAPAGIAVVAEPYTIKLQ